jgi:hypothetical protein
MTHYGLICMFVMWNSVNYFSYICSLFVFPLLRSLYSFLYFFKMRLFVFLLLSCFLNILENTSKWKYGLQIFSPLV